MNVSTGSYGLIIIHGGRNGAGFCRGDYQDK